jgi:hypothetical protein
MLVDTETAEILCINHATGGPSDIAYAYGYNLLGGRGLNNPRAGLHTDLAGIDD